MGAVRVGAWVRVSGKGMMTEAEGWRSNLCLGHKVGQTLLVNDRLFRRQSRTNAHHCVIDMSLPDLRGC